jgi:hypothetical protein
MKLPMLWVCIRARIGGMSAMAKMEMAGADQQ